MCGRTACTLNPQQISSAARYRNSKGKNVKPKWRKGDEDKYRPSYNKAPQSFCPVLLHARHIDEDYDVKESEEGHERILASMKWGLVPSWVKEPSQAQYKMNNARSDTMLEKASYRRPLEKGQRCVVLADGFYEWNTTKTEKQPYFIYFKDDDDDADMKEVKIEDKENGDHKEPSRRLVTMAGIFERRKSPEEGEDDLFTFSVITVDSHPAFSWLHHRMPAMLENEGEVQRWLDNGTVPLQEAVELIKPKDCLTWYPVSKFVNNSRNNSPECMVKIDPNKVEAVKESVESKGMARWLAKSPTKVKQGMKTEHQTASQTEIKTDPAECKDVQKKFQTKEGSNVKNSDAVTAVNSPRKSPTKKGQKRRSNGSVNLMEGWLKKVKKE